jgi:quercetin dioxygenase-like cupin family protein
MAVDTRDEITVGDLTIRFLLEGPETAEAVAMFEFDVPAGARVPTAHSHDGYEETIYGLEGVLTWTIDGTPTEVGPGEALCIPRNAVHKFENLGDVDAKALAITTPGVIGPEYFREAGEILAAATDGPPDLAALGAVMRKHGLTPVA